jgi:hypothetical protein
VRNRGAFGVTLLLTLVVAGCGSAAGDTGTEPTETIRGYGLSIELPAGWHGDIVAPPPWALTLRAANFPLSPVATDQGQQAQQSMGPDDILITLVHYGRAPEDWRPRRVHLPLAIERANFTSSEGFVHPAATDSFVLADGAFQLWAVFGRETPSDELLAEANRVLATVAVEPRLLALGGLSIELPVGWDGFAKQLGPDDENPALYAANVRWPDVGQDLAQDALQALFERLPADGVVVSAVSSSYVEPGARALRPPITLADGYFLADSYEGQPAQHVSTQLISGRVGERFLSVQIFFGRNDPTDAMRAEADAVLATLSVTGAG